MLLGPFDVSGRLQQRHHRALPTERDQPSEPAEPSDAILLARLAADDASALDALLGRYWSPLVVFIARLSGSPEAAEDAVQETFCRLWERRRSWRVEGSVSGLLFRLARNIAISTHRHLQAEDRAAGISIEHAPRHHDAPELSDDALRATLERAIASLPPRRREVFLLRVVHDLSYKEIGAVMGTAPQTVANQLSHALAELRTMLTPP
jgi:RNA polymerase sigma-70 factor (ECF subfamily)